MNEEQEQLLWQLRERGMCSVLDCAQPILGWCQTCHEAGTVKAYKLCSEHLQAHLMAAPRSRPHIGYSPFTGEAIQPEERVK